MESFTITAQELYNLVWKKKMNTVIEEYEMSVNSLKSACSINSFPYPDNKYWKKKEKGENAHIIPPRYGFDPEKVIFINKHK